MRLLFIVVLNILYFSVYADPSAYRGWWFYDDPKQVETQPKLFKSYSEYNQELKQEFEELQMKAIYDPTPENIKAYNVALRMLSNNAVKFAELSVTQNWQDPNAGISVTAPNGAGLNYDLEGQRRQISEIIKRYAVFYFIAKDCKYCSVQANELKRMEYTYHIIVRVVSMDGSNLPQYPNPTPDTGIAKRLGVVIPGEMLVFDSTNNKTTVLGFGYVHFDQIAQRIQTLFITGTANWDQYRQQPQPIYLDKYDEEK